jgi:hypothetical protein
MRVPPDQLGGYFPKDLLDIEAAGFARDFRMHDRHKDQIAQFFTKILIVACPNRPSDFICFLNQARKERFVCLLSVPRAAARGPELGHDLAEPREVISDR